MKIVDYVLILLVVFLLGYGIYQKRISAKEQNQHLTVLSERLHDLQSQLNQLKNQPNTKDSNIIKEFKELSINLTNQLEILSEDLASKLEKNEEKIDFLMEQEKKKQKTNSSNTNNIIDKICFKSVCGQ